VCFILSFASICNAATYVNGNYVDSKLVNGQNFVPVRVVSENLNCLVDWDSSTNSITISGDNIIVLTVNNKVAFVGNNAVHLNAPPSIYNGITYVPIRFVSECLGVSVTWDGVNAFIGDNSRIINNNGPPYYDYKDNLRYQELLRKQIELKKYEVEQIKKEIRNLNGY